MLQSFKDLLHDTAAVIVSPRSAFQKIAERERLGRYVLPIIMLEGVALGALLALFSSYVISQGLVEIPPTDGLLTPEELILISQYFLSIVGFISALITWILVSGVLYIIARLVGGASGFQRSLVPVGFAAIPFVLLYASFSVISALDPSILLLQLGPVTLVIVAGFIFLVWSTLLLAWGSSSSFGISLALGSVSSILTNFVVYGIVALAFLGG